MKSSPEKAMQVKRRVLWWLYEFGEWLMNWAESRLYPPGCELHFGDNS